MKKYVISIRLGISNATAFTFEHVVELPADLPRDEVGEAAKNWVNQRISFWCRPLEVDGDQA